MEEKKRLIDANALREKLQAHHDFFVNAWGGFSNLPVKDKARVDEITNCIAEVVNAIAVDAVEVVHGRWIGETGGYMWWQNCSVCNGPVYNKMKPYYNYCPYCGAKMDK